MSALEIISGSWHELSSDAKTIRTQVFIQEQLISPEDEWDAQDELSTHFVVYTQGDAMGTARLLPDNHIGRVAILISHRGLGAGRILMQHIIDYAKQQQRQYLVLSAQVYATQFYRGLGFEVEGEEYLDCNIPHVDMRMDL